MPNWRVCFSFSLAVVVSGVTSMASLEAGTKAPAVAPTIEVVNDKKKFDLLVDTHKLIVLVKTGTVQGIEVRLIELAGGSLNTDAVTFDAVPAKAYAQNQWIEVPVRVDASKFAPLGPGSFDLIGMVRALDNTGKVVATAALTMSLTRAEHQLTAQTTPLALDVRRWYPFAAVSATHCVQLRTSPRGRLSVPTVEPGEVIAGVPPRITSGTMMTGRFGECPPGAEKAPADAATSVSKDGAKSIADSTLPPLIISTTLPVGVTSGSATLRVNGPDVKAGNDVAVQVYVKDALFWPLLVVLIAVVVSYWIHRWVQSGRSAAINLANLTELADDLLNLELLKAGALDQQVVREIRRALSEATRLQERGDVAAAATTIAAARKKLDDLVSGATTPAGAGPRRAPRMPDPRDVTVETAEGDRTTGLVLTFSVLGPLTDPVRWEIGGVEGDWKTLDVTPAPGSTPPPIRVVTDTPIRQSGVLGVRVRDAVKVGDATTFTVAPSKTTTLLRKVRRIDFSIDVLAGVISALATTVAIGELASFGTFRDYFFQFAGAFGITESVKGFAQTIAAIRKTT